MWSGRSAVWRRALLPRRNEEFDAALVDVSLGQDISAPIADQLLLRRIPFAFATGYADMSLLPAHLRRIARLSKPYAAHQVRELLDGLLASARTRSEPG